MGLVDFSRSVDIREGTGEVRPGEKGILLVRARVKSKKLELVTRKNCPITDIATPMSKVGRARVRICVIYEDRNSTKHGGRFRDSVTLRLDKRTQHSREHNFTGWRKAKDLKQARKFVY